jgi:hypothetical protein
VLCTSKVSGVGIVVVIRRGGRGRRGGPGGAPRAWSLLSSLSGVVARGGHGPALWPWWAAPWSSGVVGKVAWSGVVALVVHRGRGRRCRRCPAWRCAVGMARRCSPGGQRRGRPAWWVRWAWLSIVVVAPVVHRGRRGHRDSGHG